VPILNNPLQEIEERAPALKKQREDYDRAVSAVNTLTTQLEEARQEYGFRKRDAADARQKMGHVTRENARLMQQVRDLGRQVAVLVREVEASRAGRQALSPSRQQDLNQSSSDNVISERLLDFHSVSELQQKNIELLAVVRELSSKQELAESHLVEEKTAELRRELESAAEQLQELRAARQRQETMVESIIIERDMYKTLAENTKKDLHKQQQQQDIVPPAATSTPTVASGTMSGKK
jgi:nucleoprotein TPR